MDMEKKICPVCGKEIVSSPYSGFCSKGCYHKNYVQKHKKHISEYQKEYHNAHKTRINKKSSQWLVDNKEKWQEYLRNYRKKMREEVSKK